MVIPGVEGGKLVSCELELNKYHLNLVFQILLLRLVQLLLRPNSEANDCLYQHQIGMRVNL